MFFVDKLVLYSFRNFAGAKSKSFCPENVDLLDKPEQLSSMAIPGESHVTPVIAGVQFQSG